MSVSGAPKPVSVRNAKVVEGGMLKEPWVLADIQVVDDREFFTFSSASKELSLLVCANTDDRHPLANETFLDRLKQSREAEIRRLIQGLESPARARKDNIEHLPNVITVSIDIGEGVQRSITMLVPQHQRNSPCVEVTAESFQAVVDGISHSLRWTSSPKRPKKEARFKIVDYPNVRMLTSRPSSVHCSYYNEGTMRYAMHTASWRHSDIDEINDQRKFKTIQECQEFYNTNHKPPASASSNAAENDAAVAPNDGAESPNLEELD